jgi:hypothetical protein
MTMEEANAITKRLMSENTPVVGLPMRAGDSSVVASVTCLCQPGNGSLLIVGVESGAVCPKCKATYAILAVSYDRRVGKHLQMEIGRVVVREGVTS